MKSSLSFYEKTLMESENLRRKGKWWAWGIGVNNQANGMSGSCLNKSLKAQVLSKRTGWTDIKSRSIGIIEPI
jgi:hypothetical protein